MTCLRENYKTQLIKFVKGGVSKNIVADYLERFKVIANAKYKIAKEADIKGVSIKGELRFDIDRYKTFSELEAFVDYVSGQVDRQKLSGKAVDNIEIDATPLVDKNGLKIYYAVDKTACIKYKGIGPYSWCISRADAGNMYNTYRYKDNEPTFYFVKDVAATEEEFKEPFSGEFKNPWHFIVIQKTINGEYVVTNSNNDGDDEMSWDDIVSKQPKLHGMEEYFKSVPLTAKERELYKKYVNGVSDEEFEKLSYEDKSYYLDIAIPYVDLGDNKFLMLPDELKNKYIGFGVIVTDGMYEYIKTKPALLKRFVDVTIKVFEMRRNQNVINLSDTQIDVLLNSAAGINFVKTNSDKIDMLGVFLPKGNIDKLINIFGKEEILKWLEQANNPTLNKFPQKLFLMNPKKNWPILEDLFGKDRMAKFTLYNVSNSLGAVKDAAFDFLQLLLKYQAKVNCKDVLAVVDRLDTTTVEFALDLYKKDRIAYEPVSSSTSVVKYSDTDKGEFLHGLSYYITPDNKLIWKFINTIGLNNLAILSDQSFIYLYAVARKVNLNIANRLFLKGIYARVSAIPHLFSELVRVCEFSYAKGIELLGGPVLFKKYVKETNGNISTMLYNSRSDSEFEYIAHSVDLSSFKNPYSMESIIRNANISIPILFKHLGKKIIELYKDYAFNSLLHTMLYNSTDVGRGERARAFVDYYVQYGGLINDNADILGGVLQYCRAEKFSEYAKLIGVDKLMKLSLRDKEVIMSNRPGCVLTRKDLNWDEAFKIIGPVLGSMIVENVEQDFFRGLIKTFIEDINQQRMFLLFNYIDVNKLQAHKIYMFLSYFPRESAEGQLAYLRKLISVIGVENIKRFQRDLNDMFRSLLIYNSGYGAHQQHITRDIYIKAFIDVFGLEFMTNYVRQNQIGNTVIKERHESYKSFFRYII